MIMTLFAEPRAFGFSSRGFSNNSVTSAGMCDSNGI
ncbi:MAG: hypothetical protein JWM11_1198 [Planctomycetaceae bacterium]|nr:hypothetical protein [Planctomycetaceae bacterium]